MSYLVLARKWRPQTFADLVGQEHVAQTLKNAIAQDRVAHAFLFTGARGVGKTTIARVLAKSLNCMSASGPTAEPCAKCSACDEIARGIDVDVKEIDGASNNSVDDVRRLQESLPYMPARDRFKVVIIDEVHMLSTGAFNALLKTLEEPPAHVKFIFATTEVHKVPITILSRCQRYDFKLIPTLKIRDRVDFILNQEGVAHDDAAVALVAREAAGSMRDALSLLDQVIAGAPPGGTLAGVEVARLLGVADRAVLYDLARALLKGDAPAALKIVESVSREGYDLPNFARDFLAVLRDLVVARVVPDPDDLLDLADEEKRDVKAIAREADAADLERLFVAWSRAAEEVARAREQRWVIEMALVRLAHRPQLVPIDELVARLADLEKRLGAASGGEPRGPAPAGGAGAGGGRGGAGVGAASSGERAHAGPGAGASPTGAAPRWQQSPGGGGANPGAPRASAAPAANDAVVTGPRATGGGAVTAAAPALSASPAPAWLAQRIARAADPNAAPIASAAANSAPAPAPPPPRPQAPPADLIDTRGAAEALGTWTRVLEAMENGPIPILKHAVPLEVGLARVRIAFETGSFYARKIAQSDAPAVIAEAVARALGAEPDAPRPEVEIVQGALPEDAPTIARREEAARNAARAAREEAARAHPLVKTFLELIGGEVRGVKLDEG